MKVAHTIRKAASIARELARIEKTRDASEDVFEVLKLDQEAAKLKTALKRAKNVAFS